ncbi:MAG TPA: SDR family oxidoreductase [Mycobacterium sp.]|nr:SDR family oxidoreductase [Mycobacterium sp.]
MIRDVCVVIGVGGMGVTVARRLGSGRSLVLADIDAEALRHNEDELLGEGHHVTTAQVDVTSHSSVAELAAAADAAGPVTSVVHTAGLSPEQASVSAILAVDLLGVALTLDAFGAVIAHGGAGVVIASMAAHLSPPLAPDVEFQLATAPVDDLLTLQPSDPNRFSGPGEAYAYAKRVNQLCVAQAATAWGRRGARINSISPGIISTAMGRQELAGESGGAMQAMIDGSGCQRIGTADDIAGVVDFLLSPAANFVTGTDILVDGGVTAAFRTGQIEFGQIATG